MSIQFLFDECVSPKVMNAVQEAYAVMPRIVHITERFSGFADEVWIPQISLEGSWVVVSADQGRKSIVGTRLPELCRQFGVTCVLMSTSIHQKNSTDKTQLFLDMWPEISGQVELAPAGSRFKLKYQNARRSALRVVLIQEL